MIGLPDEELARLGHERSAQMLIVGTLGARSAERWRVGSLAARLAHAAPVPVLVVADAAPFEACSRGERALRVLVAADRSIPSDLAIGWLPTLRRLGPCDVVLEHLYDPAAESRRLGMRGAADRVLPDPQIEALLLADLRTRAGAIEGPGTTEFRVSPWPSWPAEGLSEIAEREHFDLILVGGRRRSGLAHIRHDSVADRLLRRAATSVFRVPWETAEEHPVTIAQLGRVLVSTDLSPVGNAVIPWAYALVAPGGRVHLLHVIEEPNIPNPLYAHYRPGSFPKDDERASHEDTVERQLRSLVPREAERRGIETHVEIVHDGSASEAIRAAAERLDVEAVCMATHGRSGISRLVAGSIASEVAAASTRPLLLLRPTPDV